MPASEPPPLEFPFDAPPAPGERLRLGAGLRWLRLPLPFALDHVNCWLLEDADGERTLIDTGIASEAVGAIWRTVFAEGWPERLLVTHFHPDHSGLAAHFAERGSALLGSAVECEVGRALWAIEPDTYARAHAAWYRANGLPPEAVESVRRRGNGYRALVAKPPEAGRWRHLDAGERVGLGGREFEVLVGGGHAPAMLMLYDAVDELLIAADQVLPSISPNVSLVAHAPGADPDPLARFLETLERLRALPERTLVLPSHGRPFRGLHARLEALGAHHAARLERLHEACAEPRAAAELFDLLFARELDAQQLSFALGESLAHLAHLERRGELERLEEGGVTRFRRR